MPKRKRLSSGLASKLVGKSNVSDKCIHDIVSTTLTEAGLDSETVSLSQWKKLVLNELPTGCLREISLPPSKGTEPLIFHCCNIKTLLQHIVNCCPNFACQLLAAIDKAPAHRFDLIAYHDECTAGNVLQHGTAKKCSLFYFAVKELGFLHHEEMWHPLAMIQHRMAMHLKGGFAAAWKGVLRSIMDEDLHSGLDLVFPSVDGHRPKQHRLFFCSLKYWLGDLDAHRISLDAKGSAGMKCCVRCKNVVKKDSEVSALDPYFVEITCSDSARFDLISNEEIFGIIDELCEKQLTESKSEMRTLEQVAGFKANAHGAMADPEVRAMCPPDRFLFDPFHMYYGNGCCSWEICLLMDLLENHGISRCLLQSFIADTSWKTPCSCTTWKTASARGRLLDESYFSGDVYKGSGLDLHAVLPLLGYYLLESDVAKNPQIQPALKSYQLLLEIRLLLSDFQHGVILDADRLDKVQSEHQQAFAAAYTTQRIKPKHHVRMHLPQQFRTTQLLIDTLPMEKRHRVP